MECPTCHKSLKSETLHGQAVDRCAACGGVWLDQSTLGLIVRNAQGSQIPMTPVGCVDGIVCPQCREPLAPFNYAHDSGVFINQCDSCRGVWLAPGQLDLLAQYRSGSPAVRKLESVMADEMRAANKLQFARRLLRSRLLSGIVALAYLFFVIAVAGSLQSVFSLLWFLMLPIACIWFPDVMSHLWAISLGLVRPSTQTTPGDFVAIGGWVLLLCPAVLFIVRASTHR